MIKLRPPWRLLTLFALLSGTDLLLTCRLLGDPNSEAYEANWLAAHILGQYGFSGLVVYKGLLVALVGGLICLVGRRRPPAARRLGAFACAATGLVVLYSVTLWVGLTPHAVYAKLKDITTLEREAQDLNRNFEVRKAFAAVMDRWEKDLAAGRCTLCEALTALLAWDESRRTARLISCWTWRVQSTDRERLAAMVMRGSLCLLRMEGSAPARLRAEQLLAGYLRDYGPALADYVRGDFPWATPFRPDGPREMATQLAASPSDPAPSRGAGRRPRSSKGSHANAGASPHAFCNKPWRHSPGAWRRT
jgi:hypothetical protein